MYSTLSEDVNCPLVARIISRNRFQEIKSFLHVCGNNQLDLNDKWSKLRPLVDLVNKKLMQFGIFSYYLSTDEHMVPYFERHSCKMLIRGKPVRLPTRIGCFVDMTGTLTRFTRIKVVRITLKGGHW